MIGKFFFVFLVMLYVHPVVAEPEQRPEVKRDFDESKTIEVFSLSTVGQSDLIELEFSHADILKKRSERAYVQHRKFPPAFYHRSS